ncbi:hypothetical protein D3C80_1170260 [compost metagenome]
MLAPLWQVDHGGGQRQLALFHHRQGALPMGGVQFEAQPAAALDQGQQVRHQAAEVAVLVYLAEADPGARGEAHLRVRGDPGRFLWGEQAGLPALFLWLVIGIGQLDERVLVLGGEAIHRQAQQFPQPLVGGSRGQGQLGGCYPGNLDQSAGLEVLVGEAALQVGAIGEIGIRQPVFDHEQGLGVDVHPLDLLETEVLEQITAVVAALADPLHLRGLCQAGGIFGLAEQYGAGDLDERRGEMHPGLALGGHCHAGQGIHLAAAQGELGIVEGGIGAVAEAESEPLADGLQVVV